MTLSDMWHDKSSEQKGYELVPAHEYESTAAVIADVPMPDKQPKSYGRTLTFILTAFALSLAANLVFAHRFYEQQVTAHGAVDVSLYARVPRNVETPWVWKNPFWHEDDDATLAQMWDSIDLSPGTVALSDDYVESMGLPRSQRFPWDGEKGIYQLDSYHNLHCLIRLHKAILEAKQGHEQTLPWSHALHCIDSLRQAIMCEASDIPRYTGMDQPDKASGFGQKRMCRDWNKVADWGRQHDACWRYINGTDEKMDLLERFKFCPEGSPYMEKVYERFGPPSGWKHSGLY